MKKKKVIKQDSVKETTVAVKVDMPSWNREYVAQPHDVLEYRTKIGLYPELMDVTELAQESQCVPELGREPSPTYIVPGRNDAPRSDEPWLHKSVSCSSTDGHVEGTRACDRFPRGTWSRSTLHAASGDSELEYPGDSLYQSTMINACQR